MHGQKCGEGFLHMYGSWLGAVQKKGTQGGTLGGQEFSANFDGASQDFDSVLVIFSGFQSRTPLKPLTGVKPVPEMDSAPSK